MLSLVILLQNLFCFYWSRKKAFKGIFNLLLCVFIYYLDCVLQLTECQCIETVIKMMKSPVNQQAQTLFNCLTLVQALTSQGEKLKVNPF